MIHIAVCEDNDADLAHLRSLLCQTKILCDFTEYTSAEPLLLDLENGQKHFDLYAFHYLIKPVRLTDLTEVLTKAADQISAPEETLPVMSHRQKLILRQADIVYIDSSKHMLCFHMQDGQQYVSYGKLDEIQAQLASGLFVRCHKSFIVNLIYVSRLTREGFHVGDTLIPISRTYAAGAKDSYYKRLFGMFQEY